MVGNLWGEKECKKMVRCVFFVIQLNEMTMQQFDLSVNTSDLDLILQNERLKRGRVKDNKAACNRYKLQQGARYSI